MNKQKNLRVIFSPELLRKDDVDEMISLVRNELIKHGIRIKKGLYVQMTVGEVSILALNSYRKGSPESEAFIMKYTVDSTYQFLVEDPEGKIGLILPRVSSIQEESSKFSSCSEFLVETFGSDLPGWCWY